MIVTGLCLAVSALTFSVAAAAITRKGLRAASFYGSVLAMIVPCLVIDVALLVVETKNAVPPF
ncbi:hypothetical protein GGF32_005534 [Allomyces javanicus]|nr:hypothetical protein GGF32_005534 [Allomyces javanicus]